MDKLVSLFWDHGNTVNYFRSETKKTQIQIHHFEVNKMNSNMVTWNQFLFPDILLPSYEDEEEWMIHHAPLVEAASSL